MLSLVVVLIFPMIYWPSSFDLYEPNKMISKCVRTYLAPYKYTTCNMRLRLVEEICLVRNIQYINYG